MKLIIDIDETTYDLLKQIYNPEIGMLSPTYEAVVNGIPLDKHKEAIEEAYQAGLNELEAYHLGYEEGQKDRQTGHWIGKDISGTNFYGKCSECGQEFQIDAWYTQNMNYCPNCGSYNGGEDT